MPLVTSGQFAYVYKLNSVNGDGDLAVRCFRGYLKDRDERYLAIQENLRNHSLPFLSDLTYASEGILVEGQRFPILYMKWIDGPTLDLYLDNMIGRRDVILHLGQEWIKLVEDLREAGLAHGDLQHGNIIVERGRLRLVDHDGMFTPEMAGWQSSELGHQHYQHPRRDEKLFNAELDNFSALVIYLSLISLAENPGLWTQYHDENLLFTKTDFLDPHASRLFSEIKGLGSEHERLATILEEAARDDPNDVPFLGELVSVKSRLPAWMTAPMAMEPKTKTREVVAPVLPSNGKGDRWRPWKARESVSKVPVTTPSSDYQTIFGGPATLVVPPGSTTVPGSSNSVPRGAVVTTSPPRDPADLWGNTGHFAKEFMRRTFIWWYWGIYICLKIIGLDFFYAFILAVSCLLIGSLIYGFIRAFDLSHNKAAPSPSITGGFGRTSLSKNPPSSQKLIRPDHLARLSITGIEPIVGNSQLNIYHLNDCSWVALIPMRNRIGFASPNAARASGYKPCRVCAPLN
jgi:hypothetical protein